VHELARGARAFITAVVAAAVACVLSAVFVLSSTVDWRQVLVLAALYVATESFILRGSRDMAAIALGSIVSMAALPLVGARGAIVLAGLAVFAAHGERLIKRVFNAAQITLSVSVACLVYVLLGGTEIRENSFPWLLIPYTAALFAHCVTNGALVAVIVRLAEGVPIRVVVQGTMVRSVPNYLGYGLFGLLLAVLWDNNGAAIGPAAALLLLLPLFIARWAYAQFVEEQHAYERTVTTLMAAVETKDVYTRGHSERVARASELIANVIGMRDERATSLRYAAILHDIGKLGVPTRVLQKSGGLTDEEFAAIQMHPMRGREMVIDIKFLDEAYEGIYHHHERLDGLGYPNGLRGKEIPEFARIIAVADAFDSMTSTRSYRGARTLEQAVVELRRCAGTQFDPIFVEALVTGLEAEGWSTERTGLPEVGGDAEVGEHHLDHDDPTAVLTEFA
jgi:HD-GYP domain-containing protein (c-di-GMP phosphodiesterase class II)